MQLLQLHNDCLEHVTTPAMTEVIQQVGVALGHPASQDLYRPGAPQKWVSRTNAQVSCGWNPASMLIELLSELCHALRDTATLDLSEDGDIWQHVE